MDLLQVLQNRAAKPILGRDLHASATQALRKLNWMPLAKKRTIDRCIFVYKCLNNLIIHDFGFYSLSQVHSYNTRNKDNLSFQRVKTNWGLFRTVPHCSKYWNSLDLETRNIDNFKLFRKKLFLNLILRLYVPFYCIY
jgi:hypothetical protein